MPERIGQLPIYDVYFLGAVSGDDLGRTRRYRQELEEMVVGLDQHLLNPNTQARSLALMDRADVFIGEASGSSDERGFEAAYGLYMAERPVLLFRHQAWGEFADVYGNNHPLLYVTLYDKYNLEDLMVDAIGKVPAMIKEHQAWRDESLRQKLY